MKAILALTVFMSLQSFAQDKTYEVKEDGACVMQIMKEAPASLIIACGVDVYVNNQIQPLSQMQDSKTFLAETRRIFTSRVTSPVGVACTDYDSTSAYIVICKRP